jgi:hypothetical protein
MDRLRLRAALRREAAAHATVRRLREELAVLVPNLFAAEQAALLFWHYQVALGDATQHAFEQHLAAFTLRRSRGVWRPVRDWWCGTPPAASKVGGPFTSIGAERAAEWGEHVSQVTMAAKRVLVRRGLLDITHGLRLAARPGAGPARRHGRPAGSPLDPLATNGGRSPAEPAPLDGDRPGEP